MEKSNKSRKDLHDEAEEYVLNLPDETAEGRLVNDSGSPADQPSWDAEEEEQQSRLHKPRDL